MSETPNAWEWARFGDLIEFSQNGCGARQGTGSPTVVLRLADVSIDGSVAEGGLRRIPLEDQEQAKYELTPGDLLAFRVNGSPHITGQVIAYPGPPGYAFCDHFIRFRLRAGVLPKFAAYAFRVESVRRQVASRMVSTAGQNTVSQQTYADVHLPLAPLHEQQRIIAAVDAYFTRLDDAVSTLKRVQRNLKRYRASVLKAAVEGRLVPTEAELARAEKRDYEPASELLKRILAERRRRWEDAEVAKMKAAGKMPKDDRWKTKYEEPGAPDTATLPVLPQGWCWTSLDQLLLSPLANGRSVPDSEIGFPVLRLTALKWNRIDLSERKIGRWTANEAAGFLVEEGDFLVARGNGSIRLVGRGGLVPAAPDPVAYPDTLIRVRVGNQFFNNKLLAILWNSQIVRSHIEKKAKTTAGIHKINQADLAMTPIPLAPYSEQERLACEIERQLSRCDEAVRITTDQLLRCARLRQSILKWAFEGKLVDQDPDDEPAAVLLERIRAERAPASPSKTAAASSRRR